MDSKTGFSLEARAELLDWSEVTVQQTLEEKKVPFLSIYIHWVFIFLASLSLFHTLYVTGTFGKSAVITLSVTHCSYHLSRHDHNSREGP